MGNDVFANGREISCKSADGKSICAFPDVCFTPPQTPATPPGVPIPYPNTGLARDTTSGSRTVKISGKEVMLRNKSYFKKSLGDEAGCAPKKGILTSVNRGKVYFISWSPDVKFEGENVVRHLDVTTHNHNPTAGNESIPFPHIDTQALSAFSKCSGDKNAIDAACTGHDPCPGVLKRRPQDLKRQVALAPSRRAEDVKALDGTPKGKDSRSAKAAAAAKNEADASHCVSKNRCLLRKFGADKDGNKGCCPGQSPHHIPPKTCFKGVEVYNAQQALCVCLEGTSQHVGSHGKNHAAIDYLAKRQGIAPGGKASIANYNKICADAVAAQCGCNAGCIEQQLNASLKPTNRNIRHWDSSSKQLDNGLRTKLNKLYKAASAPRFSR